MEDNSASDDEILDSPTSPKLGGKKLKLNDGSSQDSLKESGQSSSKDENVDSGVSADKSESASSDDPVAVASEGPSNEVVNAAPSGSNVHALLLNLRRPRWGRNYRKRKTPDRDSDSNSSSRDSDDLSEGEPADTSRNNRMSDGDTYSDSETVGMRRLADFFTPGMEDSRSGSSSSSDSNDSYDSSRLIDFHGDTDSDEEELPQSNENDENDENKGKPPPVLQKPRPTHNYMLLKEIINREMGLTFPVGKAIKEDVKFEQKFYGSLHAVYRMKNLHNLNKHRGCVNCINFHPEGHLLASGSDDTNVVVWDWARNKPIQSIKTGHKSNVFQSKFLHLNARSQLNIVTCARDGQVRLLQCHPSGGTSVSRRKLATHSRPAHKLHVCASEPHVVISAGEDGLVMQCDVRADQASRLFQVKERSVVVPLYSISGHPLDPRELIVAGRDMFVRMYDRRKSSKPIAMYSPTIFQDQSVNVKKRVRLSMLHLTCAVYNHDGSEILGSYNDEDIYLFDAKNDVFDKDNTAAKEGYTHSYSGHKNSATIKGVAFFGPNSEYVISGSDCSYIYIWDKKTESIVQWMLGDMNGVVNCIEAHPRCPVLATSGLDKNVKIWIPKSQNDPTYEGLEKVVRENSTSHIRSPLFNDFLPTLYNAWRGASDDSSVPVYGGNIDFDGNGCTAF